MKKLIWFLLPLALFIALSIFLFKGLYSDPTERDMTSLNREFPAFSLPDLMDEKITYDNSIFDGQVTLVNVWGVWCVTCAIELPYLTELRQQGHRIIGLYYDQDLDPDFGSKTIQRVRTEVQQTLNRFGDPYQFNVFDVYRDTSLDLGVTGAPEMLLVDHQGVIRLHHIGDVNERVWRNKFMPLITQINAQMNAQIETQMQGQP